MVGHWMCCEYLICSSYCLLWGFQFVFVVSVNTIVVWIVTLHWTFLWNDVCLVAEWNHNTPLIGWVTHWNELFCWQLNQTNISTTYEGFCKTLFEAFCCSVGIENFGNQGSRQPLFKEESGIERSEKPMKYFLSASCSYLQGCIGALGCSHEILCWRILIYKNFRGKLSFLSFCLAFVCIYMISLLTIVVYCLCCLTGETCRVLFIELYRMYFSFREVYKEQLDLDGIRPSVCHQNCALCLILLD